MKVTDVVGVSEYKKGYGRRKRLVRMMILIFGLASIVLVVLTYYGHNAGNFVIRVNDQSNRAIAVSESLEGFNTDRKTTLSVEAIQDAQAITYETIEPSIKKAMDTDGRFKDPIFNYMAYSFYVMNVGERIGTLTYTIRCLEESNNMGAAVRIMVVEQNKNGTFTSPVIYRKSDPVIDSGGSPIFWDETDWQDDMTVFVGSQENFGLMDYKKFTFFVWLEGNDPDTTDDIIGGKVKFDMLLSINTE